MSESITLYLGNPDIILMRRPESPALVHGQIAPDAHAMLVALWDAEDRPKGTASVERGEEGLVAVATITSPIEIDLRVVLDLPPEKAAGLERRPSAMVMATVKLKIHFGFYLKLPTSHNHYIKITSHDSQD